MMPTVLPPSDPSALTAAQEGISRLVERDLRAAFARLDVADARMTRDAMVEITARTVDKYGEIAANFTADWYDTARSASHVTRPWTAKPQLADTVERVVETVHRVAADLFTDHPETMIDRLIPHAQQQALESVRETITVNTAFDQASTGWVRVTNAGACDYCEDLADGVVWGADDSADFEAHTNCNCTAAPVFN